MAAPTAKVTKAAARISQGRRDSAKEGMRDDHAAALRRTQHHSRLRMAVTRGRSPNGPRNPQNRGISGYERISRNEAINIASNEIKRQRHVHGPGALGIFFGSHPQWGNVGYYLSALLRFGNLLGNTRIHADPDSWEVVLGRAAPLRVEPPCRDPLLLQHRGGLKEAEIIVFWSSDPESTDRYASGLEGTQRRFRARELGIEFVRIDPHLNRTAQVFGGRWIPIRPGTDSALAIAIMHVWITEGLYDKEYVAARCENCHNCQLTLKDEFVGNAFPDYSAPEPRQGHE